MELALWNSWRWGKEGNQTALISASVMPAPLAVNVAHVVSSRHYDLDQLLDPRSITCDPMDYRLSWHLWEVLRALNYSHLCRQGQGVLNASYAAQLESEGLWEWAVFVVLHEPDTQ